MAVTEKQPVNWGVSLPLPFGALREHREHIEALRDLGYSDAWTAEGGGADAVTPLAAAAAWNPGLRLGTAIIPVYTRGPGVLAQTAATLAELGEAEVLLGIGSSVPEHVTALNGIPLDKPLARIRDTARFLRAAVRGEDLREQYETFAAEGFRLARIPDITPKILVAALRPRMLRLAFDEADGAITNLLFADDVPTVVSAAGPRSPGQELVVKIFVCPTEDIEYARGRGRRFLAWILNRGVYRKFHEWLGRGDRLAEAHRLWDAGLSAAAGEAIPDDVVDELWINGSVEHCRAKISRFLMPGVTSVNLYLAPTPEIEADPGYLLRVLEGLGPGAPR